MKYIIALFGESGCGKDTIKDMLLQQFPEIKPIMRITTRPMREGEEQYTPYIFVSEKSLQKMALEQTEEFMEVEQQRDWFYATHKQVSFQAESESGGYLGCYSMDSLDTLYDTVQYDEDFEIIPIKIVVDEKKRLCRQLMREETPDCYEICRRFMSDLKDYGCEPEFPYFTVENNGELQECLDVISIIIKSEVLQTYHEDDDSCDCGEHNHLDNI